MVTLMPEPYSMTPLGDQAVLVHFDAETPALQFAAAVRQLERNWLVDVVQAYTSVAVFFDLNRLGYHDAMSQLKALAEPVSSATSTLGRLHVIPCCYEFQLDLERIARHTNSSAEDIIQFHSEREYTVYAIGFCPGFPYLGYLPDKLCGVPRLETPRLRVAEGSVGLTGRQTGIYTQVRPGGWNILGRTPLQLVDVEDEYFPIRTGDRVRFQRIDEKEFRKLQGSRE